MPSMFRSPDEVTSSDPKSSSKSEEFQSKDGEENQSSGAAQAKDEKPENAPTLPEGPTTVPNLDATGHSNFIMSTLLEEHCLNKAAEILNSVREDPDVQALGRSSFVRLSKRLSSYGLIDQGYDGDDTAHFRQGYLQGLDYMALNVLQEEVNNNTNPSATQDSHGPLGAEGPPQATRAQPGLRQLLAAPEGGQRGSLVLRPVATNVQLQHALSSLLTNTKSNRGPLTIDSSNSHFFYASRYSNDFAELGFLGKGGYGKVYHVLNHLDGQEYAVKKITLSQKRLKKLEDGGLTELEALLREIRTLAKFEHSNVVRYFSGWVEQVGTQPAVSKKSPGSPRKMLSNPSAIVDDNIEDDLCFGKESDLHHTREEDDGIIFGYSSEPEEQALLDTELNSKQRRGSHATTSSARTRKSYVHSFDKEDGESDAVQHDQGIPIKGSSLPDKTSEEDLSDLGLVPNPRARSDSIDSAGPTLTLHIQMSLHPISLSQYLSPDVPKAAEYSSLAWRHCYHLGPSLRLMLAILSGAEYLHSQNYVHRDLKPGNILLSVVQGKPHPAGSVVVSPCTDCDNSGDPQVLIVPRIGDFGLVTDIARPEAKAVEFKHKGSDGGGFVESLPNSPTSVPLLSTPGVRAVGTEFYRPSILGGPPNEKYDVFALGVIAVELLCKFTTKMERHATLSNLHKGILPTMLLAQSGAKCGQLETCIRKMLCADETERYGCKEVRNCMEDLLAQEALG
ncbi:MAG: hypothetical protein M1836_006214 [Candelina mexicana]|nr:MAG: hypothetical protein M1836_006214 [Candelina mexicana]